MEALATTFQFFPGDFLVFGIVGALLWVQQQKEDEDFK